MTGTGAADDAVVPLGAAGIDGDAHGPFRAAVDDLRARGRGRMVPDLDRITDLLGLLGDPQLAYPTIHVTGTNGKGSTTRMTAALLAAAGLSAGTTTSPHLQTVRERMTVAGRRIGERAFADLHADVAPLAELVDARHEDRVTYFELLTAMALWWFAEVPVDVGVVEVGMGGTWDATNLVRGDVAVIGEIDVDHSELGGTAAETAVEKAGIVKPGADVVLAAQRPEVAEVVRARARAVSARVREVGVDLEVVARGPAVGGQSLTLRVLGRVVDRIFLPLAGAHQARNAVLALGAVAALLGERFGALDDDAIRAGFAAASAPGRLEVVARRPTVVLDGAHNPHGARAAAAALREVVDLPRTVLVAAVLADKDAHGILTPWREHVQHVVVTRAPSPRAAPRRVMEQAACEVWGDAAVESEADVPSALARAETLAGPDGAVVVVGSLHTIGAARDVHLPVLDDDDEVVYEPEDIDDADDERAFEEALDAMIARVDADREG